jgi:hypothetical protein
MRITNIESCYSTAGVSGIERYVGGLIGYHSSGEINNCYATGNVSGIGFTGGLVGLNASSVNNSLWDLETSGQTLGIGDNQDGTAVNIVGANTAEMLMMSTYTDIGWDFAGETVNGTDDIWNIESNINDGFPHITDLEGSVAANDSYEIPDTDITTQITLFPNPFNPVTNIQYELAETGKVLLEIYNMKGRKVDTLIDEKIEAGKHSIIWNAAGFSSGIYFLSFETEIRRETKKLILLK